MSDWSDFAQRCADNVRKIRETQDDGAYAKLYAQVDRLLQVLSVIDREEVTAATAFKWVHE